MATDYDSAADDATLSSDESAFGEFCSREWIAADSWTLFCAVMNEVSKWYEWREPPFTETSSGRGQVNLKPYVLPINVACNHMQNSLLKSVDPVLHDAMQSTGIEPQFYGLCVVSYALNCLRLTQSVILLDDGFACCSRVNFQSTMPWFYGTVCLQAQSQFLSSLSGYAWLCSYEYEPNVSLDTLLSCTRRFMVYSDSVGL